EETTEDVDCRNVVISRDRKQGSRQHVQESTSLLVFFHPTDLREVTADHHRVRLLFLDYSPPPPRDNRLVVAEVQVRQVHQLHGATSSTISLAVSAGVFSGGAGATTQRALCRMRKWRGKAIDSTSPSNITLTVCWCAWIVTSSTFSMLSASSSCQLPISIPQERRMKSRAERWRRM